MLQLQLPDAKLPREIHLKSDKGEIDVFLCPDETHQPLCDPLLDDIRPIVTPIVEKYLSPRSKIGRFHIVQVLAPLIDQPDNSLIDNPLIIPSHSLSFQSTGKSSTYPLRSAQRNLNKILFGDNDESEPLADSTKATPSTSKALEDSMLNSNRGLVLNQVQHELKFTPLAMTKESTEATAQIAMAADRQSDVNKLDQRNIGALKNDVKLNQYNLFGSYFTQNQSDSNHTQVTDQQSGNGASQSYGTDAPATPPNNNSKGVRNALMSEMGSLSPLNHMIQPQEAVGKYMSYLSYSRLITYSLFSSINVLCKYMYMCYVLYVSVYPVYSKHKLNHAKPFKFIKSKPIQASSVLQNDFRRGRHAINHTNANLNFAFYSRN